MFPLESVRIGHTVISLTFGMCLEDENEAKLNKRDASKVNFKCFREEMGKVNWDKNLKRL